MMKSDPRVFFAAERTLLAWVRTGLTVMALGFVVARFGLFLNLLSVQAQGGPTPVQSNASAILGVIFVAVGAVTVLLAAIQHRRFVAELPQQDLPAIYSRRLALLLATSVSFIGLLLAAYLVLSHPWR